MTKQELRKIYRDKRQALHGKDRLRLDDLLLLQFQQFNYNDIRTVLSYWPMSGQAEPNTHILTGYLRHMVYDLRIAYPVSDLQQHSFMAHAIDEDTVYRTNAWGITEPVNTQPIDPAQIDLVLVPMLVCDQRGYRVGYGKGFYDRFLQQCRKDVVKMGCCYFEPVEQISDTHEFDVPLNYCITPQHIYEF